MIETCWYLIYILISHNMFIWYRINLMIKISWYLIYVYMISHISHNKNLLIFHILWKIICFFRKLTTMETVPSRLMSGLPLWSTSIKVNKITNTIIWSLVIVILIVIIVTKMIKTLCRFVKPDDDHCYQNLDHWSLSFSLKSWQ